MNAVDLKYVAENVYGRYVPDDVRLVERNGYIFFVHPRMRYDPITLLVIGAIGTAVGVSQTLQQGKQAEKIAKARAQIDLKNAEAVRRASVEEATIEKERSVRARATAKATAAAGGIRINEGLPLVIDTQIAAATAKDIGFILERGRVTEGAFRSSAALEIARGKALRRKSKFDALSQGLLGFGQLGLSASQAGLFSKSTNIAPAGTFKATTGISQKKFGRQFIKTGFRP
ncbi:hypothetical protein LCGC14_2190670 [marine sediment metagenome]|uniref:Uncharacterized protein n=1 Tax=marine sediment metagenome TaxID=412755 RepID=A0A0F9FX11_9ZZZZ